MMKTLIAALLKLFSLHSDTEAGAAAAGPEGEEMQSEDIAADELTQKPDAQAMRDAPEEEGDGRDLRIRELEDKLTRTASATQKRIDELTARNRAQQEMLREHGTRAVDDERIKTLGSGIERLEERLADSQEKIAQSKVGGDAEALSRARQEFKQVSAALRRAEQMKTGLEESRRRAATETLVNNAERFSEGLSRALRRFPALADESGRLKADDPVVVRANELIAQDAAPSGRLFDFGAGKPVMINPRYDHVDGQYAAIRDAMDEMAAADAGGIRRLRYEKNIQDKRSDREKSKTFDPVHSRSQPARPDNVGALRIQLDEAERRGDIIGFQRLRTRIEEMERKTKE